MNNIKKMNNINKIMMPFLLFAVFFVSITQANPQLEQQKFIHEMVSEHQFNQEAVTKLLSQAEYKPAIIQAMTKAPERTLTWFEYKKIFLTPKRITEGVQFWQANEATLKKASTQYNIPPEIIVSIIGVETFYGKQTGSYRVLDALTTLAFHYPPRAAFFRSELKEFLLLTREEKLDPTRLMGSYAGAMGMPQFIASSYRRFAVNFSGSGQRDLFSNTQDVIGSVGNYFKAYGWQPGPIIIPITHLGKNHDITPLIAEDKNPIPSHHLETLLQNGVQYASTTQLDPKIKVALIKLMENNGPTYYLGFNNFYVITRYNRSSHYAMAVHELAQAIHMLKNKK